MLARLSHESARQIFSNHQFLINVIKRHVAINYTPINLNSLNDEILSHPLQHAMHHVRPSTIHRVLQSWYDFHSANKSENFPFGNLFAQFFFLPSLECVYRAISSSYNRDESAHALSEIRSFSPKLYWNIEKMRVFISFSAHKRRDFVNDCEMWRKKERISKLMRKKSWSNFIF